MLHFLPSVGVALTNLAYCHTKFAPVLVCFVRGCNLSEVGGVQTHKQTLSIEVAQLVQEERKLDELIQRCTQEVKQMTESTQSQKYPLFMLVQQNEGLLLGCVFMGRRFLMHCSSR